MLVIAHWLRKLASFDFCVRLPNPSVSLWLKQSWGFFTRFIQRSFKFNFLVEVVQTWKHNGIFLREVGLDRWHLVSNLLHLRHCYISQLLALHDKAVVFCLEAGRDVKQFFAPVSPEFKLVFAVRIFYLRHQQFYMAKSLCFRPHFLLELFVHQLKLLFVALGMLFDFEVADWFVFPQRFKLVLLFD